MSSPENPGNLIYLKKIVKNMNFSFNYKERKFHKRCRFSNKLAKLFPKAKVEIKGLSLVTKFSQEHPEFLLTCDESGYVYLINTLEMELNKVQDNCKPFVLSPKSSKKILKFYLFISRGV